MPWQMVAPAIWEAVNGPAVYAWPIRPSAIQRLHDIAPAIAAGLAHEQINAGGGEGLRQAISASLVNGDPGTRSRLHNWIVGSWGGINTAPPPDWVDALAPYDAQTLHQFVENMGNDRVSSWSKILAFADHAQYAISDSRTATALNIALSLVGDNRRFFMPLGRSRLMQQAQAMLDDGPYNYLDYLQLLHAFVNQDLCPSILIAEQVLFANAPGIAQAFVAG